MLCFFKMEMFTPFLLHVKLFTHVAIFFLSPRSLSSCQCRAASSKHTSIVSVLIFPVCLYLFLHFPLFPSTSSSPEMHMSYALFPEFIFTLYIPRYTPFVSALVSPRLSVLFLYLWAFIFSPWVPPLDTPSSRVFMMLLSLKCKRFSHVFRGHYSSLLHLLKIHWLHAQRDFNPSRFLISSYSLCIYLTIYIISFNLHYFIRLENNSLYFFFYKSFYI